jgi:integrase
MKKLKNSDKLVTLKNRYGRWVKFRLSNINPKKSKGIRLQWTDKDDPPRKDRQFPTKNDADLFLMKWEQEESSIASKQKTVISTLNQDQMRDAETAYKNLPPDLTLTEVVEFYKKLKPKNRSQITHAFINWISDCENRNLRPATIKQRRDSMSPFLKRYGKHQISDITEAMVKPFISKDNPNTANAYLSVFRTFFTHCIEQEWLKVSPIAKIKKAKIENALPSILTVGQVANLIAAAKEYRKGMLLSYCSIACFCGLRPEEIHGGMMSFKKNSESRPLPREEVHLEADKPVIRLGATQTKTRRARIIEIPDNCVQLLKSVESLPIFPSVVCRNHFKKLRENAGLFDVWKPDVMRHTWASHLYALDPNKGTEQIANVAGNSKWVTEKHYVNPSITKSDAVKFFNIGI